MGCGEEGRRKCVGKGRGKGRGGEGGEKGERVESVGEGEVIVKEEGVYWKWCGGVLIDIGWEKMGKREIVDMKVVVERCEEEY